jgi:hypothetical protein
MAKVLKDVEPRGFCCHIFASFPIVVGSLHVANRSWKAVQTLRSEHEHPRTQRFAGISVSQQGRNRGTNMNEADKFDRIRELTMQLISLKAAVIEFSNRLGNADKAEEYKTLSAMIRTKIDQYRTHFSELQRLTGTEDERP